MSVGGELFAGLSKLTMYCGTVAREGAPCRFRRKELGGVECKNVFDIIF